ncbi:MAG: alanine racemase [Hyphomicrobiales bacterium]|uniref:alanine racemase n=1 Tax=Hoeflea sp. TaxID=1940281 RepID=UPI00328C15C0
MDNASIEAAIAGARLTVDLGAIADNWRLLNDMSGNAECSAVVKANAYGLGIEQVVPTLWKTGCRTFFVALPEEGIRTRKIAPDAVIYILAGFFPEALETYRRYKLRPVVNAEIDVWLKAVGDEKLPYAIQLETGMNRLGLPIPDYHGLLASDALDGYPPSLLMSHLACADTPADALSGIQNRAFKPAVEARTGTVASLANSAGIFLGSDYHYDLVRPGIALYGGACTADALLKNPMKPTIKIESRILQIKSAAPGETVGYGGAETVLPSTHDMSGRRILATIASGYADGYIRSAGSSDIRKGAFAAWRGHQVPLLGRVSMDLTTVDLTDHPDVDELAGCDYQNEWIELIGPNVVLDDTATIAGTIGYEFLTSLGNRFHRIYTNDI